MTRRYKQIAYTDTVRIAQDRAGTRDLAERIATADDGADRLAAREMDFIASLDRFFLGTVNSDGWPYVQYRGGPRGLLKILDPATLAFADFRGNLQMLSTGNLGHDDRVSLLLMDEARRLRLKILARAEVIDRREDPGLLAKLSDENYEAIPERSVVLHVEAFDWNCPQHITPRFTEAEIAGREQAMRDHIALLESLLKERNSVADQAADTHL